MNVNLSDAEIIFIYCQFKKKINKLNLLNNASNLPISKKDIKSELNLYTSVVNKLKDSCPELSKLDF